MCSYTIGSSYEHDTKKTKNPTVISEKPGTKAGYYICTLHTAPPRGWEDCLTHPSGLTPGPTPILTLRQEIDGPQAEQPEFLPCRQIVQNSRSQRGVEPCPDKK